MQKQTPETRPQAPGGLGLLQKFINSGHFGSASVIAPGTAETVRERHHAGASQASLAVEFGLTQGFVNAILRRSPLLDELPTPEAARDWLLDRGLVDAHAALDQADWARLVDFRQLLGKMAVANHGAQPEPGIIEALNQVAASVAFRLEFASSPEPALRPGGEGVDLAIGRFLAILAAAMHDGTWLRLKRCPGTGCPFTFYDASRNRTGLWCSMSVCGNRSKVRSYQQRRRAAAGKA
jgi:hypothetical protein